MVTKTRQRNEMQRKKHAFMRMKKLVHPGKARASHVTHAMAHPPTGSVQHRRWSDGRGLSIVVWGVLSGGDILRRPAAIAIEP